jgi:hypothetical protein
MCDASVVEKEKALKIFKEEVESHHQVSMVEKEVGDSFKTKIYPLHPFIERTVKVEFVSNLIMSKEENVYSIPIEYEKHNSLQSIIIKLKVNFIIKKGLFKIRTKTL